MLLAIVILQQYTQIEKRNYIATSLDSKKTTFRWSLYDGRGERTQTFDLSVPNRARYQLRHTPVKYN
jgi:5'-3' exonuclease